MNRREWIWISGAGLFGGCGVMPGGGGAKAGWSGSQLDRADGIARRDGCRGWAAWESGRLRQSYQTYEKAGILSLTKALAGLACAKAAGEGWLRADETVAATISEWREDPGKEAVTVLMLLQQVSGLEGGAAALYQRTVADKGKVAVSLRQVDPPGYIFRYGPSHWEVLAELLHRKAVARGETLEKFMHRAVMRPLGLASPEWRSDQKGRFYLSTGAELNVTDLGRLGRAIGSLLSGNDEAGIAGVHFKEMARSSAANPIFGGGLWKNRYAGRGRAVEIENVLDPPRGPGFWRGTCLSTNQPASMVALVGSGGKRVFIWPQSNQVVARLGFSGSWRDGPLLSVL